MRDESISYFKSLTFCTKVKYKSNRLGSSTPYHFLDKALLRDFLALMYQYKLLFDFVFSWTIYSINLDITFI